MSVDTSKVATSNRTTAATASKPGPAGSLASWADDRLGLATAMKKNLRKVFPDHWSFMLGEIALWSFVVLLLTGVFLSLWFNPSMGHFTYEGSYDLEEEVLADGSALDAHFAAMGGWIASTLVRLGDLTFDYLPPEED